MNSMQNKCNSWHGEFIKCEEVFEKVSMEEFFSWKNNNDLLKRSWKKILFHFWRDLCFYGYFN